MDVPTPRKVSEGEGWPPLEPFLLVSSLAGPSWTLLTSRLWLFRFTSAIGIGTHIAFSYVH